MQAINTYPIFDFDVHDLQRLKEAEFVVVPTNCMSYNQKGSSKFQIQKQFLMGSFLGRQDWNLQTQRHLVNQTPTTLLYINLRWSQSNSLFLPRHALIWPAHGPRPFFYILFFNRDMLAMASLPTKSVTQEMSFTESKENFYHLIVLLN